MIESSCRGPVRGKSRFFLLPGANRLVQSDGGTVDAGKMPCEWWAGVDLTHETLPHRHGVWGSSGVCWALVEGARALGPKSTEGPLTSSSDKWRYGNMEKSSRTSPGLACHTTVSPAQPSGPKVPSS